MPGTGAAGIMPTDARAAVRNSALRRVIGPVMRTNPLINPYPAGQRRFTVAFPLVCTENLIRVDDVMESPGSQSSRLD
jgi:hypothetical protein